MMPSFDKSECISKFHGCRIDVDEQPKKLPSMVFGTGSDSFTEFYCPECLTGYFWDTESAPWSCHPCNHSKSITNNQHCLQCPNSKRCTDCDLNYFPNYLQTGCMLPIANCKSNPSQYANDGLTFYCPECMDGHFIDTDKCTMCPKVATTESPFPILLPAGNCASCSSTTVCDECKPGFLLQPNGLYGPRGPCIQQIPGCRTFIGDYDVKDGRFWCSDCEDNKIWDFKTETCTTCGIKWKECLKCN